MIYNLEDLDLINTLYSTHESGILNNPTFISKLNNINFLFTLSLELRDNIDEAMIPLIQKLISIVDQNDYEPNVIYFVTKANLQLALCAVNFNTITSNKLQVVTRSINAFYEAYAALEQCYPTNNLGFEEVLQLEAAVNNLRSLAQSYTFNTNNTYPDLDSVSALFSIKDDVEKQKTLIDLHSGT
jgi:hypothetical protein